MAEVIHDETFFDEDEAQEAASPFMSDDDIVKICEREIELSEEYATDELEENRKKALDYYNGEPRGDETEGNSETQSMDVADMVEATLAEVMPLFSAAHIASFTSVAEGDEDQARLESNYCNNVFMEQNSGYNTLYSSIKDALLQRNGIVEVYVDEHVKVEYDEYKNLTKFELNPLFMEENGKKKEVMEATENEDGTLNIILKTLIKVKKLVAEPVEPENFLFATNHNSNDVSTIRFCGRRLITSKSELISMGIDQEVVEGLKAYDGPTDSSQTARNKTAAENNYKTADESTTLVEVFRLYVQMDYDKDGIAELHQVLICDGTMLRRNFAKFVPFASGSPFIMSHKFMGMSLFDKLKTTQDQKTAFIRQYINNAMQMNNRRLEVLDGQVNLGDVLNSRAGGVVRSKIKGAITPIPVDDIGPSCITALEYLDKVRSERGGASLDMQTANLDVGNNVGSQGVDRQYASKEKMAALITRTLAETLIKQIYIIIHATLREYFTDEYPVQVYGEWKQAIPSKWLPREKVKMDIGMSAGERDKKVGTLNKVLDLQIKAMEMEAEDVLVNRKKIHNTLIDMLHAAGIDNPERYWIDPNSPKAIQALEAKKENAKANAQAQDEAQNKIFEYQKTIEDNKDEIEMLKDENKTLANNQKLANDLMKHKDKMDLEYTNLELQYQKDIKGEGKATGDNDGE